MRSLRLLIVLFLLASYGLKALPALAAPDVTIKANPIDGGRSVIITFLQTDLPAVAACHYNLFAAKKSRDLSQLPGKGLSIATFKRDLAHVDIIASPLRTLARQQSGLLSQARIKIYLRVLISCPQAESGLSSIISFSVPTYLHGQLTQIKGYLRDMKFHMQYYNQ